MALAPLPRRVSAAALSPVANLSGAKNSAARHASFWRHHGEEELGRGWKARAFYATLKTRAYVLPIKARQRCKRWLIPFLRVALTASLYLRRISLVDAAILLYHMTIVKRAGGSRAHLPATFSHGRSRATTLNASGRLRCARQRVTAGWPLVA